MYALVGSWDGGVFEPMLGPVSITVYCPQFKFDGNFVLSCCNSVIGHQPCTKICSDHCFKIEVRVKQNIHRI